MATKAKTNGTTKTVENMMSAGTEQMKEQLEKTMAGVDKVTTFQKDTFEAFYQSANATAKGIEQLNTEALAFSRQSMEDMMAAAKSAMSVKSVHELVELNSDLAKTQFDTMMGQWTKFGDMWSETVRTASEPINGRVNALMDIVKEGRAA